MLISVSKGLGAVRGAAFRNLLEILLTWLARQDSNLGMAESKSADLPLVDGPIVEKVGSAN